MRGWGEDFFGVGGNFFCGLVALAERVIQQRARVAVGELGTDVGVGDWGGHFGFSIF